MIPFASAPIPQQTGGFAPQDQVQNLRVDKLLMFETGTYHPQWKRPYVASPDAQHLSNLQERLAENGTGKITATTFSGAGLRYIAPSAVPESQNPVNIQGGWNERRFRFLMEVSYTKGSAFGQRFIEVLSGWTDRTDLSLQTHMVAPDMLFTINSVTHLRETIFNNGAGNIASYQVVDNSTLLGNPQFSQYGMAGPTEVAMRPMDVFSHMTLAGADFGRAPPADSRTTVTDKAMKSRRANNNPNEYLARVVDNMLNANAVVSSRQSSMSEDFRQDLISPTDSIREAKRYSAESLAIKDTVLRALQNQAMYPSPQVIFTYSALCALDPTIDARKFVKYSTPAEPMMLHDQSRSHAWNGTDSRPTEPTHQAVILSLAIPAIMTDVGLTRVDFHATNHTLGSQLLVTPTTILGFSAAMDTVAMFEVFKQRLIFEVLNDLVGYGEHSINLFVQADLAGETVLNISFDGYPGVDFVAPSFTDTLVAPVTTGDRNVLNSLTNNLSSMLDSLDGINHTPAAISSTVPPSYQGGVPGLGGMAMGGDI